MHSKEIIKKASAAARARYDAHIAAIEKKTGKKILPSDEYEFKTIEKYYQEEIEKLEKGR